jgi:flagellar basal-body rod modification protein FlgD
MKNQDPTSNTDPNEYINQLVQVNSLEQLIDVNQNLVTGLGISSSSSSSSAAGSGVASDVTGQGSSHGYAAAQKTSGLAASQLSSVGVNATDNTAAATAAAFKRAPGSLSIPEANASAQRVAHSLNGQ